jgi:arylamine N-acetyltransferase
MLTEDMLAAYLARIGVPGPLVLDAEALRELHQAHLMAVPLRT